MASRIEKTIARQREKISEGNFYEAHQQLRVIATRYVKASNWSSAIEVLHGGALALLTAGQGGSGGDLSLYLIDVYNKAELEPNSENKAKIFAQLRAFPADEPTRKRFIGEALGWSSKFGEYENGDPELHHVAGTLYAQDSEPYDAERHLALGTRDSPEVLARLEYEWYQQDDLHTAPLYAARAIFPYLLTSNLRSANKAWIIFTSRLSTMNSSLGVQDVSSSTADVRLYPSLPLLNFLGLLLLACERGGSDIFRQLTSHYGQHLKDVGDWSTALAQIGELWFGIRIPKQGNPLMDMMGSLLFGGSGGGFGGDGGSQRSRPKPSLAPPSAPLD